MKRRFESGAEKRKRKKEKDKYILQQRNSLAKFVSLTESEVRTEKGKEIKKQTEGSTTCAKDVSHVINEERNNNEEESERTEEQNENELKKQTERLTTCGIDVTNEEESDLARQNKFAKVSADSGKNENHCDFPTDIALWPMHLSDKIIQHYLINKPCNTGDITTLKVEYTDRNRSYYRNISESNFYCVKANDTKEFRQWLLYSGTSKSVYCYACRLFSQSQSKFSTGFNDWRNLALSLKKHESSQGHFKSMLTLQKRLSIVGRIDTHLEKQIYAEQNYWRDILKRIIATVKLLSSLGVAFRGHREGTDSNRKGNFLSCIEYLAEFDSILKVHLQKFNTPGRGKVNYLSHIVCDEFISLMSIEVKKYLISEVQEAIYYSIIVDSTPDITHIDQLTFILRFVDKNGNIKERFFDFIKIENHDSEYLERILLEVLKDLSIDIKNCRGQTYDNAANMAGKYSGLQARIKHHVDTATYVPCASHTLNLIGNCAAESCSGALHYFDFVQNLYVYFSSSTRRWNILINRMPHTQSQHIKRIADTRWASRADAVSALKTNYQIIKEVLIQISMSDNEKPMSKLEAKKLSEYFNEYETALLTVLWDKLLQRINSTSKSLQNMQYNLLLGTNLLRSLSEFIMDVRNKFDEIENDANLLTENRNYKRRLELKEENCNLKKQLTMRHILPLNKIS